ncbi:MAG TPA: alpha/beta hydrolase fold domain-containing protein [Acetobacteraceae bacterium]|nr:alpha/beta hydrolase fold domain-containing protein [Acetobacteraceae bacterium]
MAFVIIGSGFGGIGMGAALKRQGVTDFVILEKAQDVGGCWRQNTYPGAACDVPSHLYSFSFEPNPDWSHAFARQKEIHAYLKNCARKFGLLPHVRFGSEVSEAVFDETDAMWVVTLTDGSVLRARTVVAATGQLSRPVYPRLPGIETFEGKAFHSAHWDHEYELAGKRVAVVGTGASAIQFVPPVAETAAQLKVFQRSAPYIIPRPDHPYPAWRRALFRALPWTMKLERAKIYVHYESRAIAFTRLHSLMKLAIGRPFRRMLTRQVADPALREKLTPDYQIGCKRILISNDYLPALARPNVEVVTDGIAKVTSNGIETTDGRHHEVDAIIYGTGFAATEFLSPMRVVGRNGTELNETWARHPYAYLGMSVPGFPNFFLLYGPNTNLGHNSIVYMLESQIEHVMRCWHRMGSLGAPTVESRPAACERYNRKMQRRLKDTVWNGCRSWYVDASGHNSTNWPDFTFVYRWLTRHSSLDAYSFASNAPQPGSANTTTMVPAPGALTERVLAGFLRNFLKVSFRPLIGPPVGASFQRRIVGVLASLMPGKRGVRRRRTVIGGVPAEVVGVKPDLGRSAILYLHGGAYCLGGAYTHRSVTTRLAAESGLPVWVPQYRLAPEHPYPAGLEDALACFDALRAAGCPAENIVVAGDSAGGGLALALALTLRQRGAAMPAALLLLSPFLDSSRDHAGSSGSLDPMIRQGRLDQATSWYRCPIDEPVHAPLAQDLSGLPPMFVQVGRDEILLSDSTALAALAARCGVECHLEIYESRWHVFQLQAFYLGTARSALRKLADVAVARCADAGGRALRSAMPTESKDAALVIRSA